MRAEIGATVVDEYVLGEGDSQLGVQPKEPPSAKAVIVNGIVTYTA